MYAIVYAYRLRATSPVFQTQKMSRLAIEMQVLLSAPIPFPQTQYSYMYHNIVYKYE